MVAAIVLAAGEASRFGGAKQALLLPDVVARVRRSGVGEIVAVTGAHAVETDIRSVHCADWRSGPGASLRCGLQALGDEVEAAVVVLADGPELAPAAIDRVVASWRATGAPVVAASYGGARGHPVVVGRQAWERIPDEGARSLDALLVPCDDLGAPGDVDTRAQLPERFRPMQEE